MAKKLVLAVAGSGKTTKIIGSIRSGRRTLIITYTNENLRSIEGSLVKEFGRIPAEVTIMSYFSFLYSFCFRPFFSYRLRDNSYTWNMPLSYPGAPGKKKLSHYMTSGRYLYSNRVAKLILEFDGVPKVVQRLEKYFDDLFIDEIQDFAGNDFNFLMSLCAAQIEMLFVGDFFQHTFDTSRDGQIRTNLHKNGVEKYLGEFRSVGFEIDVTSLSKTHRCSPTVCDFIRQHTGIEIESNRTDITSVHIVEDSSLAETLYLDDTKVKLFFQESGRYNCRSNNWGKCKGLNSYVDVCVVLNQTTYRLFKDSNMAEMAESTRNKLYVACSRARGDLYILNEKQLLKFKLAR